MRAASLTEGERKTITALFADIKGSTALIEGLDPEEARAIIDPALQLMMDAVHQYDGYVAQALGDGIFALFGAGTLPEFRGRGIQTALLRTRIRVAMEARCELAVVVTRGGSVSERNCVRLGFRVAYSKVTVLKKVQS